jgi:abequosyltransferase
MNRPRLSICIPTYNFGRFIGETLASIIPQTTDEVEILVVDGASTDITAEVVRRYQETCPRLHYYLLEKKGGIDLDMAKTVDLAQGKYCWLFGADDMMVACGIKRILKEIQGGSDIYLCNRKEVRIDLRPIGDRYFLDADIGSRIFRLSDPSEFSFYLEKSTSLGAIFSYMTSIIFLRDKWNLIRNEPELFGTAYHHAYKLLSFIDSGCTLKYIKDPLVLCRLGNDSFSDGSLASRVNLDIKGYSAISYKLFSAIPEIKQKFDDVLKREVLENHLSSFERILFIKIYSDSLDWKTMKNNINELYGFHLFLSLADKIPASPVWDIAIRALRKIRDDLCQSSQ